MDHIEETTTIFPIHRLNKRITEKLAKIVSADIPGNLNKGLCNQIRLTDEGVSMTELAMITKLPLTGETFVTISAAFMQYVWLLNDIALKSIDLSIIQDACRDFGVDYKDYPKITAKIASMPIEELTKQFNFPQNVDVKHYLNYIRQTMPLQDPVLYERQIRYETSLLKRLRSRGETFTEADFTQVNLDGEYVGLVNGVYCYSIAFAMLHELSHFELGHLGKVVEDMEDERNADLNAFWSVFCNLQGNELFTAIVGVLCLLFALLMINPTMAEDNVHPREDIRILEIYDNVKDDNPKYTVLLVRLFKLWAASNGVTDFPQVQDDSIGSLQLIREFLNNKVF